MEPSAQYQLILWIVIGTCLFLIAMLVLWLVIYSSVRSALSTHRAAVEDDRRADVARTAAQSVSVTRTAPGISQRQARDSTSVTRSA